MKTMKQMKDQVKAVVGGVDKDQAYRVGHAVAIGATTAVGVVALVGSGMAVYSLGKFACKHWLGTTLVAAAGIGITGGAIAYREGAKVDVLVNPE